MDNNQAQKAELHRLFARRLPGKLRQMAMLIDKIVLMPVETKLRQQLLLNIDQSARSCESFGFLNVAKLLQRIEEATANQQREMLATLHRQLLDLAGEMDGQQIEPTAELPSPSSSLTDITIPALQPVIVHLPDDPQNNELVRALALFGFAAQSVAAAQPSIAAVIDLNRLQDYQPADDVPCPRIAIARQDDIATRLQAIRAGASAVLTYPIEISLLVQTIENLVPEANPAAARVLIVDDSRSQSTFYNKALTSMGCETRVVNAPLNIESALVELRPELILLDMQMPDCSGLELARVLRQMPAHANTPIVFLSAEENPEKQAAAMAVSGDDFLIKPVSAEALQHAVSTRVARARRLNYSLSLDGLTKVLSLYNFLQELERQCSQAYRNGESFCYVQIDFDQLRTFNERHGYSGGDRLLQRMARLLERRLRKTDVVGRLSGDGFGLILPHCKASDALRITEAARVDLSQIEVDVRFSAGIAEHIGGNSDALRDKASSALRIAKQQGGGVTCVHE